MKSRFLSVLMGGTMMMVGQLASGCSSGEALAGEEPLPGNAGSEIAEGTSAATADEGGYTGSVVPEGMEVVFEDDFDSTYGDPDPSKWSLCRKGTSTWDRYLSESYAQAYTKDGSLYLTGEKQDGEYKTGAIETKGKFDFTYGTVECRARFVRMPQGSHTGIWMMPSPPAEKWPMSGEIDIMEHLNKEGIVYQTIHSWYINDMGHSGEGVNFTTPSVDKEDWNIYGVTWDAESITFTVNGTPTLTYRNEHLEGEDGAYQWPYTGHPFYLILSLSLGGEGTWEGPITDSELPAVFEVDWIRVMQPTNATNSVPMVKIS